ncbi:hypothetical protein HNV10_04905 [Winogradskyella litoriviva]|uniref:Outer membrane protein beta-barrel domain-containing protein n=1 Tax=Winogradskyella litoriviva TaxID=1220182 RepID=A0ABX2E3E5_9FLAO|nr:outer membrane beta-barrel protein [Winogradskyella litoriviva]NRD22568.1 hypothetical protein [Winogradskyella litoriviva]
MKLYLNSILIVAIFLVYHTGSAQTEFGIKGGVNYTFFKVNQASFGSFSKAETGYYGGLFADFKIEEHYSFQTELIYIGLNDFNFLNAPLYFKYKVFDNFHILVGPSLNYFFDFFNAKLKVRADLSLAYQVTPKIDFHMKYVIGFKEISPNGLFLGIGYTL